MTDQKLTLAEVLGRAMDSRVAEINVALPGEVVTMRGGKADVRPLIKRPVPDADDETVYEDLPTIPSVPIMWPAAGGCSITLPMGAGDQVLIVFCQWDLDHYLNTGRLADPGVLSNHGLSGATIYPGSPRGAVASDTTHAQVNLAAGAEMHVDGNTDAAALASRVKTLETAYNAHLHTVTGLGPTTVPTVTSALTFDSAKLKLGS